MTKRSTTTHKKQKHQFLVITRPTQTLRMVRSRGSGDRSIDGAVRRARRALANQIFFDPEDLRAELHGFLVSFGNVVDKLPAFIGSLTVDSIEISLEITAKGSIGLLGTGGEASGAGGLKFTFKRRP